MIYITTMEHVKVIQEIVDEHKGEMPTAVTVGILEECQKIYTLISDIHNQFLAMKAER